MIKWELESKLTLIIVFEFRAVKILVWTHSLRANFLGVRLNQFNMTIKGRSKTTMLILIGQSQSPR